MLYHLHAWRQQPSGQGDAPDYPRLAPPSEAGQGVGGPVPHVQSSPARLDPLLWTLLQVCHVSDSAPHEPCLGALGTTEIQEVSSPSTTGRILVRTSGPSGCATVCSLANGDSTGG